MIKAGQNYKFVYDQVGSVREVVGSNGSLLERLDYDEFGYVLTDTAPGQQPFGFAGGLRDVDTGLVRFGSRDFETTSGRWLTPDALRFSGGDANLYKYVASDPINRRDPTGFAGEEAIPLAIPICIAAPELCIAAGLGVGIAWAWGYCNSHPGACNFSDWEPPPFYPGWQPPDPAPTICTMEQPAPPPPLPPQKDCELLFAQCVARGRSVLFCFAIRVICEFGGG
jgi:RHS repeat-associated protein